jgi:DNA polymerase-3 subunit delta'
MAVPKEKAFERLLEARKAGRFAHAYLLCGPAGSGCEWLASELAATILGTTLQNLTSHPDFHQIAPESKSRRIVTDQIRELEQALHMKPLAGTNKVAVIHDADRLQPQAANAFLKTLEEPPQGSHILLTTTIRDAVLTTILSRCIAVPLQASTHSIQDKHTTALNEAFEQALLQKGGSDTGAALRFTRFFQSRMSEIREEATGGLETQLKEQLKQYRDSIDKNWKDTREDQIKAQGESIVLRERERLLASLGEILAGALRHKIRPQAESLPNIQLIAAANETKTLLKRLDALEQTRRTLSAGVQEALALESGFLQMIAHP